MQYIGVDLAWGEGTPTRRARETGLAAIDEHGTVQDVGWARGIDAVTDWILRVAKPTTTEPATEPSAAEPATTEPATETSAANPATTDTEHATIVAVDAPLVVPNGRGMRLAERQVGMGYGRWKVAANASNQQLGWQGGVALRRRLESAGLVYASGLSPAASDLRTFFECYPYTTLVGMSELGYDVERPRYKRLDRSVPVAVGRQQRAVACDDLLVRMSALTASDPPLDIASHPITRQLIDEPSPLGDVPYKHREDLIDAVLCAWTASIWHRHGDARTQVLGEDDTPDAEGRVATIIAPARTEQRVRGRAMRPLTT